MDLFELLTQDDPDVDLGAAAAFRSIYHGHVGGSHEVALDPDHAQRFAHCVRVASRSGSLSTPTLSSGHVPALIELCDVAVGQWLRGEVFEVFLPHAMTALVALAVTEDAALSRVRGASREAKRKALGELDSTFLPGISRLRSQFNKLRFETSAGSVIPL